METISKNEFKVKDIDDTFISIFFDINFEYAFIIKCVDIIDCAFKINEPSNLALKLYFEFIVPILNVIRDRYQHEYDLYDPYIEKAITNYENINNNCLCLFDNVEEYFHRSEIKKIISNNIHTFEKIFAPMHRFFDLAKKCCDKSAWMFNCNYHCEENNKKGVCFSDKYFEY